MCTDPAVTTLGVVAPRAQLQLQLCMDSVEFGDDYFHGCYLRASDDAAARALQEHCAATLGCQSPRKFPPHVSLAYGVLDEAQRAAVRALLTDLPLLVAFDRLELWATDGPMSSLNRRISENRGPK